ncbi:helix-turn-helix transcriptional regulator [bacterium]|nr:helix-turn-helix transcriptional regulator [bacterium]
MNKKEMPSQIKAFLGLIKQTRLKKGLSHQQLADKAEINRSTVSLMESHQLVPTMSVALKVAQALDVKLSGMIKKVE